MIAYRSRFLELSALAALQHQRFTSRQRIEGSYCGRHVSRQLGGSGEFADYREYSPGEDLRKLDWRVMSRTGRAYVKIHQDETNLLCLPVIDASNSMSFGEGSPYGSKLEYAQYFVTALSHIVCHGRDQVGLAVIGDKVTEFLPPGGTSEHLSRLHELVEGVQPNGASLLGQSLQEMFPRVGRRGVMLLISDFLADDLEKWFAALRFFRHRRWEVILLHLVHPDEEVLPQGPAYQFEGLEGEGRVNCTPAEVRAAYEQLFADHLTKVRKMALSAGCDYRLVSTAVPYLQTLSGFLVERTG
jgi:uncharacterized protein (DUF58 family)